MARILLVNDEASVRSAFRKLLERRGFDVGEAGSAKAALEAIATDSEIEMYTAMAALRSSNSPWSGRNLLFGYQAGSRRGARL